MFLGITHPFAAGLNPLDLHVLGTPPAFILSQDQTLQIIGREIIRDSSPQQTGKARFVSVVLTQFNYVF